MAGDHKCPVCQATFTRPQHVARHMRSHTGDRPYKCQHCGDQFARSDLLSRHINKCHAAEKPPTTSAPNARRKGAAAACRATTSKQACDQCVQSTLPCDGANPCSKCVQRKCRCTYVKFHRQTAPSGPGHQAPVRLPGAGALDGLGLPAYVSSAGPGRYAQAPDDFMLHTDPTLGAYGGAQQGMYGGSQFMFNPQMTYAHDPSQQQQHQSPVAPSLSLGQPALDGSNDFAARYRQQAELLRRAGVIPGQEVSAAGILPSLYSDALPPAPRYGGMTYDPQQQQQQQQPQYQAKAYDDMAYLDPASRPFFRQQQHQQPPPEQHPPYGSYPGPGTHGLSHHRAQSQSQPHHAHHSYGNGHAGRSNSESMELSSDSATSSSSAASSSVSLSDLGRFDQSRPQTSDSATSRSSASSGGDPQQQQHHHQPGPGQDGFSSAFGLMSLDDPAVLAGLSADGAPFFSAMGGLPTPTPATTKEREMRERTYGSLFPAVGKGGTPRADGDAGGVGPLTARELETKELRDFWRAYMRTPLSGGGPLGATPGLGSGAGQQLGAPRPGAPKRGLSRVASLPSVKTPGLAAGGVGLVSEYAQQQQQQQMGYGGGFAPPAVPVGRTYHGHAADDLRSYEQAVMARKMPTQLNLVPRRAKGTAGPGAVGLGVSLSGSGIVGHQGMYSHGQGSSAYAGAKLNPIVNVTNSHANGAASRPQSAREDERHTHGHAQDYDYAPDYDGYAAGGSRPGTAPGAYGDAGSRPDSRGTSSSFGHAHYAHGHGHGHGHQSQSSSPPFVHAHAVGPGVSALHLGGGGGGLLRPPSSLGGDEGGSDTDGSAGSGGSGSVAGGGGGGVRPAFKRLASQTLGPEHAKRAMLAFEDGVEDGLGATQGQGQGGEEEGVFYHSGGSASPPGALGMEHAQGHAQGHGGPGMGRATVGLAERYRRMSAPTGPGALLAEGGYHQ